MERTDAWNTCVTAIKDKYDSHIRTVLGRIRDAFVGAGWHCDDVELMDGDDFSWTFSASRSLDEPQDNDVDVLLPLCESPLYDGTEDGVTFRLDVCRRGGQILGGLYPYNYTERCWVPIDDSNAIEVRWAIFERADPDVPAALDLYPGATNA